jgi:hypothetical protein
VTPNNLKRIYVMVNNFLAYLTQRIMREEFEDIKRVIRICKSKNDGQHTDQKKNDKRINNYLQNTTQKTKD